MQLHNLFEGLTPDIRETRAHVSIPTTRLVGIEVEVENAQQIRDSKYWAVKGDSSLRNNGVELVLRQPLGGADLRDSLQQLTGILRAAPDCNVSERCSLHVHVDVRDFSTTQLAALLLAYVGSEAALYMQGGKDRYDNIYCPGVTAALEQMSLMRSVVHGNSDNVRHAIRRWQKYTGINLHSVQERGSVEFRAHEGTLEVPRIMRWVSILLLLVDYAATVKSPSTVLKHIRTGPEEYITRVFGSYSRQLLEDGVYFEYYQNNLLNAIDLMVNEEFKPKRNPKYAGPSTAGDANVEEILAALDAAVRAASAENIAVATPTERG